MVENGTGSFFIFFSFKFKNSFIFIFPGFILFSLLFHRSGRGSRFLDFWVSNSVVALYI